MIEILPSFLSLFATGLALKRLGRYPIICIFLMTVVAYTVFFPLVSFLLGPFPPVGVFYYHQALLLVFFIAPLLFFLGNEGRRSAKFKVKEVEVRPRPIFPAILIANLVLFIAAAVYFNLLFVRLGYADFLSTIEGTPAIVQYHNRITTETSFFTIILLISIIRSAPRAAYVDLYKFCLAGYALVFAAYFIVNSRMQFVLLVILIITSNYKFGSINFVRLIRIAFLLIVTVISLTLLREFVIEKNYRLDASSAAILLRESTLLISDRLNSMVMIDMAGQGSYNPFIPNLDGLKFFIRFTLSPILDPAYFAYMKSIEITSPSVFTLNGILFRRDVDFPKSMLIEILLDFGILGLPLFSYVLARICGWIQFELRHSRAFDARFLLALFVLPLLMQFEKEFTGFATSILKWSPFLLMAYLFRPVSSRSPKEAVVHA